MISIKEITKFLIKKQYLSRQSNVRGRRKINGTLSFPANFAHRIWVLSTPTSTMCSKKAPSNGALSFLIYFRLAISQHVPHVNWTWWHFENTFALPESRYFELINHCKVSCFFLLISHQNKWQVVNTYLVLPVCIETL